MFQLKLADLPEGYSFSGGLISHIHGMINCRAHFGKIRNMEHFVFFFKCSSLPGKVKCSEHAQVRSTDKKIIRSSVSFLWEIVRDSYRWLLWIYFIVMIMIILLLHPTNSVNNYVDCNKYLLVSWNEELSESTGVR